MRFSLWILCVGILLSGCSSVQQQLEPNVFYKRDTVIGVNGQEYEGVVVIPNAASYELTIKPKGDIDLMLIRSCHREASFEKLSPGWFGKNQFKYTYIPQNALETNRVCPLRIDIYESKKGRHSWAFLDFEHPQYQVQAMLSCNGKDQNIRGVGVCQAGEGLVQRLRFMEPIRFAPPMPETCAKPKKVGDAYEFEISKGECLYHFDTQDRRLGRVTFIGYEGVLVREAQ